MVVACWTILKLSQVAPAPAPFPSLPHATFEAAGSCQRRCSVASIAACSGCTRETQIALLSVLVQLTRKYDKRKQESSGQLIDQDDDDDGTVQRPPAGQNFSKTFSKVYGPFHRSSSLLPLPSAHPSPPSLFLFLAAFQECCNAACSYRVRHCVRQANGSQKKKNESVAIISGPFLTCSCCCCSFRFNFSPAIKVY